MSFFSGAWLVAVVGQAIGSAMVEWRLRDLHDALKLRHFGDNLMSDLRREADETYVCQVEIAIRVGGTPVVGVVVGAVGVVAVLIAR